MFASVIIPTHNRVEVLRQTLTSLSRQFFPADQFEVIVIDDGSTDGTDEIASQEFPFPLHLLQQSNTGATRARNLGADKSRGEVLIFIDDDIEIAPKTLNLLIEAVRKNERAIVMGSLAPFISQNSSVYARIVKDLHNTSLSEQRARVGLASHDQASLYPVHFSECMTGLLAVRREDFFSLGMFQDPTGSWPNWDDVAFGYTAYKEGFQLLRNPQAMGIHHDYSLSDLRASCRRTERASRSAVLLFQKYPSLFEYLDMFHDKTPISLKNDSAGLIFHKLVHAFFAWKPVLLSMERLIALLEHTSPHPILLQPLYRWVSSSYIYRGYRDGLRQYQVPQPS
jgi:glycosyltransferase involved in cell wall biosynthesis